jgi:hypothetical protein
MYELKKVKSKNDLPEIQRFQQHSPPMVGAVMYFMDREGDGKILITSPVVAVYLRDSTMEITTKNSVYELKECQT